MTTVSTATNPVHANTASTGVGPRQVDARHGEVDMGKEGSVRAAVVALVLTVVSALAIFPFILPTIPV